MFTFVYVLNDQDMKYGFCRKNPWKSPLVASFMMFVYWTGVLEGIIDENP